VSKLLKISRSSLTACVREIKGLARVVQRVRKGDRELLEGHAAPE
jgi:DNA-binding transcriptional regulator GbsR (MarR family)